MLIFSLSDFYFIYLLTLFVTRGVGRGHFCPYFLFQISSKRKKVRLCPFMTFSYYLFWTFLPNFSRKFWLTHELLWFCQRSTEKFQKKFFSTFFFFLKQLFLQNISSILYAEVVNIFFFIWNHIYLLVFENKYIRIGDFVVFYQRV